MKNKNTMLEENKVEKVLSKGIGNPKNQIVEKKEVVKKSKHPIQITIKEIWLAS